MKLKWAIFKGGEKKAKFDKFYSRKYVTKTTDLLHVCVCVCKKDVAVVIRSQHDRRLATSWQTTARLCAHSSPRLVLYFLPSWEGMWIHFKIWGGQSLECRSCVCVCVATMLFKKKIQLKPPKAQIMICVTGILNKKALTIAAIFCFSNY